MRWCGLISGLVILMYCHQLGAQEPEVKHENPEITETQSNPPPAVNAGQAPVTTTVPASQVIPLMVPAQETEKITTDKPATTAPENQPMPLPSVAEKPVTAAPTPMQSVTPAPGQPPAPFASSVQAAAKDPNIKKQGNPTAQQIIPAPTMPTATQTVQKKQEVKQGAKDKKKPQQAAGQLAIPQTIPVVPKPVAQQPVTVTPSVIQPTNVIPQAPIPQLPAKEMHHPAEEEIVGIDTVDLEEPQGNWLFKRVWWERAEAKYEKLRGVVAVILDSRMKFFAQRSELDKKTLDPFYVSIGLSQGELQELIRLLMQQLEEKREKEGALDADERGFLALLQEQKDELVQLQKNVEMILKLDNDVDDALTKLMEQINKIRAYEQEAWLAFKEIARVLNDKKARELFYKVDTAWRNINDMKEYIQNPFTTHFDQLIGKVQSLIMNVMQIIKQMQEKGLNFQKEASRLLKKTIESEVKEQCGKLNEKKEQEEPVEQGFIQAYIFDPLLTSLATLWYYTKAVVTWPLSLFGWGSEEKTVEEQSA